MRDFKRRGKFNRDDINRKFGKGREEEQHRRPEMFEATCDKCGKGCEVPFRPSGGKPVYCSQCYRKQGTEETKEENTFSEINRKLDKIMKALKIS